MPLTTITRRDLRAQPILFIRSHIPRTDIAAAIASGLGRLFTHAGRAGVAVCGPPLARYPEAGPDSVTIDVAIQVAASVDGAGDIQSGMLPEGPAVVAVHTGPYDQLANTYRAIERWIHEQHLSVAGAPWEVYVTDPGAMPDPADWRTEVYWPVAGQETARLEPGRPQSSVPRKMTSATEK